jgi:hypothetical protein
MTENYDYNIGHSVPRFLTLHCEFGGLAVLVPDHVDGSAHVLAVVRLDRVVDHQVPGFGDLKEK